MQLLFDRGAWHRSFADMPMSDVIVHYNHRDFGIRGWGAFSAGPTQQWRQGAFCCSLVPLITCGKVYCCQCGPLASRTAVIVAHTPPTSRGSTACWLCLNQDPDAELLPLEGVMPPSMAVEWIPPPDAGLT